MTQQKMRRCPYGCILVNANIFKEIDFYDFNMFFNLVQICFLIKRIFCRVSNFYLACVDLPHSTLLKKLITRNETTIIVKFLLEVNFISSC